MKIGDFFVKKDYVTQEEVNKALELQKSNRVQCIGEILVKMNAITNEQLSKYVSAYVEVNEKNHPLKFLRFQEGRKGVVEYQRSLVLCPYTLVSII